MSACLSESLNAAFPSPKDDEHFSPEADAAVSEMTGNAALLAQVRGWGRGRLDRLCVRGLPASAVPLGLSPSIWASWELTFQCLPS